ncbi:MAG: putative metal-dependent enzyme (double-stranded beta helix superfamily) [Planctomycetota bacterium]|jgi:predicted metal-dependent enzyme (double-stranded beta helix superfamily)
MSSFGLADYVQKVTELVTDIDDPHKLVESIMPLKEKLLQVEGLIPDEFLVEQESLQYTRNLLHADPKGRFVVMALVWKAGAETPPHDHKTWGVVGTYRNAMSVVNFAEPKDEGGALEICGEGDLSAGSVVGVVPPRLCNLHIMKNPTDQPTITIHTYGDPADTCRLYCKETGAESDVNLAFHQKLA